MSVLIALIGETRASELTFESFLAQVLDPLDADLGLCVRSGEPPNPFYERASHAAPYSTRTATLGSSSEGSPRSPI